MPPSDAATDDTAVALADLRRARRRRRLAGVDRFESLYRAYLAGFLGSMAVVLLSNLAGDRQVTARELQLVIRHGPSAVGLLLALCVAVGLRSGGRGGPIALAAADVRHVLLAPVDRALALRGPALRQLRTGAFGGAVAGAIVGVNASHRLPHPSLVWIAAGAAVGLATALAAFGAALLAGGARLGRRVSGLLALLVLSWPALDLVLQTKSSPFTMLGGLALAPVRFHPLDLVGLVVVLLVPVGLSAVGGTSLEQAEDRSRLVGQMRFGATLGDVRTVLVLRRQLAQEHPRRRPWVRVARPRIPTTGWASAAPGAGATGAGPPGSAPTPGLRAPLGISVRRSAWALARWPLGRLARQVVLAVAAGAAACGVWKGTKALVVVVGLCAYLAALDAIEPMAQQVDHPDRTDSVPRVAGQLRVHLLVVPMFLMFVLGLVAVAAAIAIGAPPDTAFAVGIPTAAAVAVLSCCGAAVATLNGPDFGGGSALLGAEVQGAKELFLFGFPVACCVAGTVPLLSARSAASLGLEPGGAALQTAGPVVVALGGLVLGWVRFREDVRRFFAEANESAKAASRQRAAEGDGDDG